MGIIVPRVPFVARRRPKRVFAASPVLGPVLIGATYDAAGLTLVLTFDRAVQVVGGELVAETMVILDGPNASELLNTPEVYGMGTATLSLSVFGNAPWTGEGVTLSASAGTGIIAADSSEPWAGVTNVELPLS